MSNNESGGHAAHFSASRADSALEKNYDAMSAGSGARGRPPKRKKKKSGAARFFTALLIVVLALALAAGGLSLWARREISGAGKPDAAVMVEIPEGASTTLIAQRLKNVDVIGSPILFRLYAREKGVDGSFQYGTYDLIPSSGYDGVILALQQTASFQDSVTVTIPEGLNGFEIGEKLEQAGLCTADEFLDAVNNDEFDFDFVRDIPADDPNLVRLEGYLFPDTYAFFPDDGADAIIQKMLENFEQKVLTEARRQQIADSGYTLRQIVSLAAIIQGESSDDQVMYDVSSVFHNRLQEGSGLPKLQSCTSTFYFRDVLDPKYGNSVPQELTDAYDSYTCDGIPTGVIGNPGLSAIDAALSPNDTPYYYFVTDVEYNYYFGKTYAEHEANIQKALAVNKTHGINGLYG